MEKEQELNITIEEGVKAVDIRHGEALPLHEPVRTGIVGLIDSPFNFLTQRVKGLDSKAAHIIVSKDLRTITLRCDEGNHYGAEIIGCVKLDKEFEGFGINTGRTYTTFDLADFIKMNRFHFEKKDTAMKLVTLLRNFKAKVDKDVENNDDQRGNKKLLIAQTIDSNIPASFTLQMPIFAGEGKQKFEVEININDNFECMLISPDANDTIKQDGNSILDGQVKDIIKIAPEIVIINV